MGAERLQYNGPFDAVEVQVGDGRFERVRSSHPNFKDADLPYLEGVPSSIVVSSELAALLLPPEGVEGVWSKAGGTKPKADEAVDDSSHPALRWEEPEGDDRVEPVTGYLTPAQIEAGMAGPPAEGLTEAEAPPNAQGVGLRNRPISAAVPADSPRDPAVDSEAPDDDGEEG